MQKRTKALQFDACTRQIIKERDRYCIFCRIGYHMDSTNALAYQIQQIMHIVPRSQGGLGVEQNGVLGCQHHHSMLDNGNDGCREEMMQYIEMYMKDKYPGWNRELLIYKKWP